MSVADDGPGASPRVRRAVLLTGIALGTCLVTLAYMDGARPALPGVPRWLGVALGAVLAWLAAGALVAVLAELVRRHHRTVAGHAARHGRRGAIAAARTAGRGGRSVTARLAAWAGPRWAARLPVSGGMDRALPQDAAERRDVIEDERQRANICQAGGHPGTPGDPLVKAGGYRIHTSHTTDPSSGFHDPAGAPAAALPAPQQGEDMGNGWDEKYSDANIRATAGAIAAGAVRPPGQAAPAASAGPVRAARANAPAAWKALAAATADFEPEDDGDLLEWMAGEVAGMSAYSEALIAVYESCVDSIGLDPVAMSAVHDTADAGADAATAMAYARQKFAGHYSEVREFAANGGLLPFDGRWIKGEGEA